MSIIVAEHMMIITGTRAGIDMIQMTAGAIELGMTGTITGGNSIESSRSDTVWGREHLPASFLAKLLDLR